MISYKKKLNNILICLKFSNIYNMRNNDITNLQNRIINIMKKNSPENSIKLISKIKNLYNDKELGKNKAIRLYISNVQEVVKYDSDKYGNNISEYNRLINDKIKRLRNIM